jgi:hypothetical protein
MHIFILINFQGEKIVCVKKHNATERIANMRRSLELCRKYLIKITFVLI